ncbi:MAG: VWD domain-containing protein, partial [Rhodothermus sp.]|nr:VWD domain-containing protein [Rhodothermus sp.]
MRNMLGRAMTLRALFLWIGLLAPSSFLWAQTSQLFRKAAGQLQEDIDTTSFAVYAGPGHTAILALLQERTLNASGDTRLGVLYLARHDAQGNVLWPTDNLPPNWYRVVLRRQPDSSYAVLLEDAEGRQASFPAQVNATIPPSLDDAALQVGLAPYGDGIDFWTRLSDYQVVQFAIPWAQAPQSAPEADAVETATRQAVLQALQELRQLGGQPDSSRVVIASTDNVVLAGALEQGVTSLSEAELQQGVSFAVFIAARKHPQRLHGEAVRFVLQEVDSLRYVLHRLDVVGKTIASDTLEARTQERPLAQALHFALEVGRPPEVCLALPGERQVCFLWPLTAVIPTDVAAVPGDGSVILTWSAAKGAISYNVYLAAEPGVTKDNWQQKAAGQKLERVESPLVITGLENDRTYYFVVTAVGVRGESRESAEVSAMPEASPYAAPGPRSRLGNEPDSVRLGPPIQGQTLIAHDGAAAIVIAPQELTMEPGETRTLGVWVEDFEGNRFAGSEDYLEVVVGGQGWTAQWIEPGNLEVQAPAEGAIVDSAAVIEVRSQLLPDSSYYAGQVEIRLVKVKPNVVVVPEEKVVWPVTYPLDEAAIALRRGLFTEAEWAMARRIVYNPPGILIGVIVQEDSTHTYQIGEAIVSKGEGFSLGGIIEAVVARNNGYVLLSVRLRPLEELYEFYVFPDDQKIEQQGISLVNPNNIRLIWPEEGDGLYKQFKRKCNKPKVTLYKKKSSTRRERGLKLSITCEWTKGNSGIEAGITLAAYVFIQYNNWKWWHKYYLYGHFATFNFDKAANLLRKIEVGLGGKLEGSISTFISGSVSDLKEKGPIVIIPIGPNVSIAGYWMGVGMRATLGETNLDEGIVEIARGEDAYKQKIFDVTLGVKGEASLNIGLLLSNVLNLFRGRGLVNPLSLRAEPYIKASYLNLVQTEVKTGITTDAEGFEYYELTLTIFPFTIGPVFGVVDANNYGVFSQVEKEYLVASMHIGPFLEIKPTGVTYTGAIVRALRGVSPTKSYIGISAGLKPRIYAKAEGAIVEKILGKKEYIREFPVGKFFDYQIGTVGLKGEPEVNTDNQYVKGTLSGATNWASTIYLYRYTGQWHPRKTSADTLSQMFFQNNADFIELGRAPRDGSSFQIFYDKSKVDCSTPTSGIVYLISSTVIPVLNLFTIPLGYSYLGQVDLCNPEFRLEPPHLEFTGQKGDRLQKITRAIAKDAGTVTVSVSDVQGPFTVTPTQATITPPDSAVTLTVQTECTEDRLDQRLTGSAKVTFATNEKQVPRTLSLSLSCKGDDDNPEENPPITGDLPPARGGSWGDPHITTFDRHGYDFHGIGDYLAARSTLPGDLFEIQVRHKPWANSNRVSVNAALAANVDGHRVEVYPDSTSNFLAIWINGQHITGTHWTQPLSGGGSVVAQGTQVIISWKDGSALTVRRRGSILDYRVLVNGFRRGYLIGLLGDADGNPNNDLRLRDGTVLENPLERDLYLTAFREDWRIPFGSEESLFSQGPDLYDPLFPDPNNLFTVEDLPEDLRAWAELICRAQGIVTETFLRACILDVAVTGDPNFALSSLDLDPNVPGVHLQPKTLFVPLGEPDRTRQLGALVTGVEDKTLFWEASEGVTINPITNNLVEVSVPDAEGVYEVRARLAADSSIQDVAYLLVKPPTYVIWTGEGDGRRMSDCANWLNNQCPGPNNDVYILVAQPVTIDLDGRTVYSLVAQGPITFRGSLTLKTGGELRSEIALSASRVPASVVALVQERWSVAAKAGGAALAQAGASWTGGTITVEQGALQLAGEVMLGNVTLNGQLVNRGHLKILDIAGTYDFRLPANSRLENLGTIEQTGDLLATASSAQLINRGRWILLGNNPNFFTNRSSTNPTFQNEGYLAYQGSGTATWYYLNFTNRDSLEVRSGTWRFDYGSLTLQDGSYAIADSAQLIRRLGSTTLRVSQPTPIAGRLVLENTTVSGDTVNFVGNGLELVNVTLNGQLVNRGHLKINEAGIAYELTLPANSRLENLGTIEQTG